MQSPQLTYAEWETISRTSDLSWKDWGELVRVEKRSHVDAILDRCRGMTGASEGTAPNANAHNAISDEIVINEREQSDSGIQVRRPEIVPQIEVIIPVTAPEAVPAASIATPEPPPPAPPVMVKRSEVQEPNVSRAITQINVHTYPAYESANKGG